MTALPAHQDWDEPCTHREAYEAVTTHTRTANGVGPDHCAECSAAIGEWVTYPCPRAVKPTNYAGHVLAEGWWCMTCEFLELNFEYEDGTCQACGCKRVAHAPVTVVGK